MAYIRQDHKLDYGLYSQARKEISNYQKTFIGVIHTLFCGKENMIDKRYGELYLLKALKELNNY